MPRILPYGVAAMELPHLPASVPVGEPWPPHGLSVFGVPASVVLDIIPSPAALWSVERDRCVFNAAAVDLFGFCEAEVSADGELWLARMEPDDREGFTVFCRAVQENRGTATCHYRFLPRGSVRAIALRETAQSFTTSHGDAAVLSRYAARRDGRRFAHKVGNHLQAIRGEIDLLRLSGALPQEAAESIARSIDAIHCLADEMEKS